MAFLSSFLPFVCHIFLEPLERIILYPVFSALNIIDLRRTLQFFKGKKTPKQPVKKVYSHYGTPWTERKSQVRLAEKQQTLKHFPKNTCVVRHWWDGFRWTSVQEGKCSWRGAEDTRCGLQGAHSQCICKCCIRPAAESTETSSEHGGKCFYFIPRFLLKLLGRGLN